MHLLKSDLLTTSSNVIRPELPSLDELVEQWQKIPDRLKAIELNPIDFFVVSEALKVQFLRTGTHDAAVLDLYGVEIRPNKDVEPGDHRLVY